ncbi:restriction modification system DNA specificity domain [Roseovarius sp. TM1035]|uniref:restriction endonuclease subunit S n=1 Tax=Roseovarius sp. TM1035 TaxID=391613 RepID=UPI0001556B5B|nr:restriction endonuclease subunit S [Roseovarius sp. TM1035]AWZ20553.1 Type I restriction-modification system, specificity subunit S [Roseovarius sp. AK1035]EDM31304.1 restriction modification system DNA specificity domain [Roseovarius sp. TM1035]
MTATIPLGELVSIRGGGTPSRGKKEFWGGPIPWATVKDFKTTSLDSTLESITEDGVRKSATNIVPAGSIVVPTRMAVGKAAINTIDVAINQDLKALLPKGEIDTRFLLHFLLSKSNFLESQAQGATVKGIKLDLLKSLPFPDLSLNEQRRIAAILDKADAIRRKREQALNLADEFLMSVFLEMFGDPIENPHNFPKEKVKLHLSKSRAGTQSGPFGAALKKHEYVPEGIPVWGVENVQYNRFIDKPRLFITEDKFNDLLRYSVQHGDILISRAGTVGRMCIASTSEERSIISTNLIRVALDPASLTAEYFVSLFSYLPGRVGALKANNKDDAFTFLNPKTLKEIEIPIPDMTQQKRFVSILHRVQHSIRRQGDQLAGFSDLFSSLSQRAFRGEL